MVSTGTAGLVLNLVSAVILLGPDIHRIGSIIKRLDPVHILVRRSFEEVKEQATDYENEAYSNQVSAGQLSVLPLRYLLNRYSTNKVSSEDYFNLNGQRFGVSGDQLEVPRKHTSALNFRSIEGDTVPVGLHEVEDLIEYARIRRMYVYGFGVLFLGFLIQLGGRLGLF